MDTQSKGFSGRTNGSEYSNHTGAKLLEKLWIELHQEPGQPQPGPMPWGKAGTEPVIRKTHRYGYIAGEHCRTVLQSSIRRTATGS